MTSKKATGSITVPPDPDSSPLSVLLLCSLPSKKNITNSQDMDGSLIVDLILLGKCGL